MSRILPILLSVPSVFAAPTANISQLHPAPATTSSQDYTPTQTINTPKDYLDKLYNQALPEALKSITDVNLWMPFGDATIGIRSVQSWDFVQQYISKATFYDFGPKFLEVLTKHFKDEAAKFLLPTSTIDKDAFIQSVNDEMIAFLNDPTVQTGNLYKNVINEKEVTDFVAAVKQTGAIDKTKDDVTIISESANAIINDLFTSSTDYANFIATIKATFTSQATFNDKIIELITKTMKIDDIQNNIKSDIQAEITSKTEIVKDFGLKKMVDNISTAKDLAINSLSSLSTDLATLKTVLLATSSTTQQIKDAVNTFMTAVTTAKTSAIKIVDDAVAKEISEVQTEWKAITGALVTELTYTDFRKLNDILISPNPIQSIDEIVKYIFTPDGTNLYNAFATKWNDGKAPDFLTISRELNQTDVSKLNLKVELSSKLSLNQSITQIDKDVYTVVKPLDIRVKMSDVVALMEKNATSMADDSNRDKIISTLDMDNVFNQIDQTNFEPDLLEFKTMEDLLKLIPSLKTQIENDPILSAKLIDTTTNELNFNVAMNSVVPENSSNPSAKVRNYKISLTFTSKTDATDSSNITDFNILNIPVFDSKLDDTFASAFKNAIEKSSVLNIKTPIDLVLGELWKWQLAELQKTNPAATEADITKGPGKFTFTTLDQFVNLLGADPVLGTLSHVADDKDIAFLDSLLKLKVPNGYNTKAFDELRSMFYAGSIADIKSMGDALSLLRVSGELEIYKDPTTNELKARLNKLVVQSRRALLESTTLTNIELEIHTFNSEIAKAGSDLRDIINYYRPLIDEMKNKGQITQNQTDTLWANVESIYNKFKTDADPANLDTIDQLNKIKDDTMKSLDGAISSFYGNNPTNIKNQLDDAKAKAEAAEKDFMSMFLAYTTNANPKPTPDEIKAKLDDIKRLFELRAKDLVSKVTEEALTDQEKQEMSEIDARIPSEYKTELNKAFEAEKAKFTIEAVVEYAYQEAARIEKGNNVLKDIATEKIADYLATAKLDNIDELLDLKSFLKEDMLGQKINLSAAMKYALIGLGSFIGLVGVLTTFSTLRSFKTNRNISQIGDDASISYQKPKKTMAIKGIISIAALGAAASVITLVLTLGGGL